MTKAETTKHQKHCRAPQGYVCCCVNKDEIIEDWSALGGLDGPEVGKHFDAMARLKVDEDGDSDEN